MKLAGTIAAWLILGSFAAAHPLHISVTNITFDRGMIVVSMKTFLDDWETAYFHYHSLPIDFSEPGNREIPWFREYLTENFRISAGKDLPPITLKVDTILLEEGSMTIEMSGSVKETLNSLYLYHAILIDIFPDQTNLVIFSIGKRETGIKFDVKNLGEAVMLN